MLYRLAHAVRVRIWRAWPRDVHGVRVVALDNWGRILLIRHSYGHDTWMAPGGGLHRGEDPLLAARRELLEETGCRLTQARIVHTSVEDLHGSRNEVTIVAGRTRDDARADGREIIEARFFSLDALPAAMAKGLADRLRDWAAQI